jgi:glucose dehydrogenase
MRRSNPCEKVLGINNVGNLALKWSYKTGGFVQSAPAVANGVLYIGSDDNNVYAFNANTGGKLWSYGLSGPPFLVLSAERVDALCRIGYDLLQQQAEIFQSLNDCGGGKEVRIVLGAANHPAGAIV